jgi:competence protein ComGC
MKITQNIFKNHNKFITAFSLIEMAVVLLVVAILLAGISKGIEAYYDMKLSSARAITEKSPVPNIENLQAWFETTMPKVFTENGKLVHSINNDLKIEKWQNDNPQIIPDLRTHVEQSTLANRPTAKKDGINSLPSLYFDGVDDYIGFYNKILAIDNFTIFAVAWPEATCNNSCAGATVAGVCGQKYLIYPQHGDWIYAQNGGSVGVGVSLCTNSVNVVEHTSSYMPLEISNVTTIKRPILITVKYSNKTPNLYVNSGTEIAGTATTQVLFSSMSFGGGRPNSGTNYGEHYGYFKGFVGEIIIYSSDLSDSDRKLVETYLIEKWGIK